MTTKSLPFAYADWTWLNGNARTQDSPMATKYFTPEFRADVNYILDFNHPKDDSMGGSTESFRSDEVQVEQLSFGGDIRVNNVRGRFLTMYGMFSTTTPRNDASPGRGQWDLADAYRYVSEAWGGYHWNVQHGLNLDAGIFVSYIGLFSYYNFDTVSYTHLDVYKRQALARAPGKALDAHRAGAGLSRCGCGSPLSLIHI